MKRASWLWALRASAAFSGRRRSKNGQRLAATASHRIARFERLEPRHLLATLTVNSPLDNLTSGDGLVTLREAIVAANTNTTTDLSQTGSGADTIQFDPAIFNSPKTIQLVFSDLLIHEALTINGPGGNLLTIVASSNSRIFDISGAAADYVIKGLTLTGGHANGSGGAIRALPVSGQGKLTIDQCTISGNVAAGAGGGIYSKPQLMLTHSIITGNKATGQDARGGGFHAYSSATVTNCTVSDNSAGSFGGGFVVSFGGIANVSGCTINGNTAGASGGGFAVLSFFISEGVANVTDCMISGNRADGRGGGFHAFRAQVVGSTITGNQVTGTGGGVNLSQPRNFNLSTFVNSTISGNTATDSGGGIYSYHGPTFTNCHIDNNMGGGIVSRRDTVTLNSSTVNNNHGAGPGGGIAAALNVLIGGDVILNFTTVSQNSSDAPGGGIFLEVGNVILNSSLVSGNTSGTTGGGIFAGSSSFSSGNVTISSSTVSDNEAMTLGGGIYTHKTISINNSTITRNKADTGGGVWSQNSLSVNGSILADNMATSADIRPGSGTLAVSYSLVGDNAGTSLAESHTPDANGNLIGSTAGSGAINPKLAPLSDNGGPTKTHALLSGSPALDAIPYYVGPNPAHDYQLNGTLADTFGGPSLVTLGGSLSATGYSFGPNQGLNLSSAISNSQKYSILLTFKWNNLSGGLQKIIDFHNLTRDAGLYTTVSGLHFLDQAFAGNLFSANTLYQLAITRDDVTKIVRGYVDETEVWNFVDAAGDAVFDSSNQIIRFFQDDTTTSQIQAQGGSVHRIRIYNQVLSAAEVSAIYNSAPNPFPDYDQRGAPFGRVKDGDGINGPQVDMGAFEAQTIISTNAPPVFTSPNSANVPENSSAVTTVTATDTDLPPQTVTFSLVGGTDQAKFAITPAGGLSFVTPPDYEAPTDANGDNIYEVTVQASDGAGGTTTQSITISVLPINDNNPQFNSPNTASIPENTTAVFTVTAVDADLPAQSITYSIIDGADQSKFALTPGGALSFLTAPDRDVPTDADGDSVYVVTVQASDGQSRTTNQTISVTVTPVNDNVPHITSSDVLSVPENTTTVLTVTATDADLPPQPMIFSIIGGADKARFTIAPTGDLSFISPPDFESPTDANGDNFYVVIVQASDGSLTDIQALLVSVTNVFEGALLGDYNLDSTVDMADYIVWRKSLNAVVSPFSGADGDGNGRIDQADYDVWRANFGRTAPAFSAAITSSPTSFEPIEPIVTEVQITVSHAEPASAPQPADSTASPSNFLVAHTPTTSPTSPSPRDRSHSLRTDRHVHTATHDNALTAWLISKQIPPLRLPFAEFNRPLCDLDATEAASHPVNALDSAFASLVL